MKSTPKSLGAGLRGGSGAPRKRIGEAPTKKRKAEEAEEGAKGGSPKVAATVKKTKASPSAGNGKSETSSLAVYVKAIDGNIVKDVAFKKAKQFRQELVKVARGDVKVVEAKAD